MRKLFLGPRFKIKDLAPCRYPQDYFYFYRSNHQGSITAITDGSEATVKSYEYDAFGNIRSETGALAHNAFTYTGREYHSESGLYYYRNRFYDPQLGRFLTQDPIGMLGGINLYAYVGNDPVNFVDSFGLEPLTECQKKLLGPSFPDIDLDKIDVHTDGIPWYVPGDPIAYTGKDYNIYYKAGEYDPSSNKTNAVLAHELLHVRQRQNNPPIAFEIMYLAEYPGMWLNPFDDYHRFEDPGYELQYEVRGELDKNYPGGVVCP
jgi:RHS repeat-associated protein